MIKTHEAKLSNKVTMQGKHQSAACFPLCLKAGSHATFLKRRSQEGASEDPNCCWEKTLRCLSDYVCVCVCLPHKG